MDSDALMLPVRDLLLCRSDVLVDETGASTIGVGWRLIIEDLFEACAATVRQAPGARLRVTDCTDRNGQLLVVFDVFGDMPIGTIDFRDIRKLQDAAETRSLRTCVHCGRPGVLRRVSAGFATRCAEHAETTANLGRAPLIPSAEVIVNAFLSHGTWLENDADTSMNIPPGWLTLFVELLAKLGTMSGSVAGLRLLTAIAVRGRFDVRVSHDGASLSEGEISDIRSALLAADEEASGTCDICGSPGRLRVPRTIGSVPTPRCEAHASLRRQPSRQYAKSDPPVDAATELSSVDRPWDMEVSRFTASCPTADEPAIPGRFALYDVRDVAAALGLAGDDAEDADDPSPAPADTEQQARLRHILRCGDAGRWRRLAHPDARMIERLDAASARAPHLAVLTSVVRQHLLASMTMGMPVSLPPLLLVGPPGVGKTYVAHALAQVLGVPFRNFPMTGASHSDSIGGSHGVWRNATTGLVARLLLGEEVANGLVFIDEVDKATDRASDDPYAPFYSLLEPIGARGFRDAYLQFPIDASALLWILAANETDPIPRPILDRLTVIHVEAPDASQLVAIARSVYAECNLRRRSFFPQNPSDGVIERLSGMSPRSMRIAIESAMTNAAAAGRREVATRDVTERVQTRRDRMGFL